MLLFLAGRGQGRRLAGRVGACWGGGGGGDSMVRDRSLITGKGGGHKTVGGGGGGGGQVKFYPYKESGGGGLFLALLKRGWGDSFGVHLSRELEVLAILRGDAKSLHPLKCVWGGGGREIFYLVFRWDAYILDPRFSHFVAPPPSTHIVDDRSLRV